MLKQVVLKGAALSVAPCLVIIAGLWPLTIFLSYGMAPCENNGWLQIVSRIALPLAFVVAAWLMFRAANKNLWKYFLGACGIVFTALLTTWLAYKYDDRNQKLCTKRSLSEAAEACKVDPKYVRRGTDTYGNLTFTLVAPGDTYEAWSCLRHWSVYNGSVSPVVDRSVP